MLRNKEIRRFSVFYAIISAIFTITGFTIQREAGLFALVICGVLWIIFLLFTRARYERLAEISDEIDRVLHNEEHIFLNDSSEEGELAILHTEITKMTVRLREQNDALRKEKQYLADSLADIAHQLRTPLTSVNLLLSRLGTAPGAVERKRLARETEMLLSRMDWLITSLLKLSRLDAGVVLFRREKAEVSELIQGALRPFLVTMDLHDITLVTEIPDGLEICADPMWLSEALQNILKNCLESMGREGTLKIVCTENLLYTEITIQDSGPGFTANDLPHLFDRFYRGQGSGASGYGIGLALSRTVIARQGGTLAAKNHSNGGALFIIRFPRYQE